MRVKSPTDAKRAEERQTTRIRMNAPQVHVVRLREPAVHALSPGVLRRLGGSTWFDLLVEQFHTRELGSTDCHEEPFCTNKLSIMRARSTDEVQLPCVRMPVNSGAHARSASM
jgi:hypothetical protein